MTEPQIHICDADYFHSGEWKTKDLFETEQRHIGAEQELFLVDSDFQPAPRSGEILNRLEGREFTTELAKFNLEFNLDPLPYGSDCLSRLEKQLNELLIKVKKAAREIDCEILLTGILPTLKKSDLELENMTPVPRYYALNDAMTRLRGRAYEFEIRGIDELIVQHDSVMLEACNTSFQLHFQVAPHEFARLYNIAQLVTPPLLAAAANSPLLFGKKLWRETRIAVFQQAVDTRRASTHLRESKGRVSFGTHWVNNSILEIFKEDIARYRLILGTEIDEDPFQCIEEGIAPQLKALCLHNSTIYRWNLLKPIKHWQVRLSIIVIFLRKIPSHFLSMRIATYWKSASNILICPSHNSNYPKNW